MATKSIELTTGQAADIDSHSIRLVSTRMHGKGRYPSHRVAAFIEIGGAKQVARYVGDTVLIGGSKFCVRLIQVDQPVNRVILEPVG